LSGVRIAVAGKGGAGKTTFSATLSRLLARAGHRVLVIDADSNPNVAVALGIERDRAAAIPMLPHTLVSRRLDGPRLLEPVDTIGERYGAIGPDGVAVVHMAMPAHADEGCLCSAHATVSAILSDSAPAAGNGNGGGATQITIVDLEASPEHFGRGTTRHVDVLFLVVEPYYRSLETARRMSGLAAELPIGHVGVVGNKLRSEDDGDAVEAFCERHGLPLDGRLPWSTQVLDADKAGIPLLDFDVDDPVVHAVSSLASMVLVARPT